MIRLETTPSCPLGLVAAASLERTGEPYEIAIVGEGHFLAHYGAPGPRLVRGAVAELGRDAVAPLVDRTLEGASDAARTVHAHVRSRLVPALLRKDPPAVDAELARVEALVADVAVDEAPTLLAALAPIEHHFVRNPRARDAFPALAARIAAASQDEALGRARARIAAAAIVAPEDVLQFWFGAPIEDEIDALERVRRWFQGGDAMDAEVRARFLPTIEAALARRIDDWARSPRGRLALILVLDQLTRNAFRGDPRTWSGDAHARRLATEALDAGVDRELSWLERMFLTMPLLHAEDLDAQRRSVACARAAAADAPSHLARIAAARIEQAEKYQAIVERFGRFPFRNAVLGRTTTDEERAFLATFEGPPRALRDPQ